MKRKLLSGILLALFLICVISFGFEAEKAKAWTGTVYIRADGTIDPPDAPIVTYKYMKYFFIDNIVSFEDGLVVEKSDIIIYGQGFMLEGTYQTDIGVKLHNVVNVTVQDLTVKMFHYGFHLNNTHFCKILKNNVTRNFMGVCIFYSSLDIVSENDIVQNSFRGIALVESTSNIISGNSLVSNAGFDAYAVYLSNSLFNRVVENTIEANDVGIFLYSSSHNEFYHNNIANNQQISSDGSANIWDSGYPSGGNYWSDYLDKYPDAKELDGSGLWDTPYVIDENNQDNYPLMYPYGTLTYKLTITASLGGKTDPQPGIHTYVYGTEVSATAIPFAGYSFDYWLLNGVEKTENPINILMDSNYTLEAYFVDDVSPEMSEPWQDPPPENVLPFQKVTVWINVTEVGSGIKNVTLYYTSDNGLSWAAVNMTALPKPSEGIMVTYTTSVPGYQNCTWIAYKIVAYDNVGNNATKDNNGYYYKYHVVPESPSNIALLVFLMLITIPLIFAKRKRLKRADT